MQHLLGVINLKIGKIKSGTSDKYLFHKLIEKYKINLLGTETDFYSALSAKFERPIICNYRKKFPFSGTAGFTNQRRMIVFTVRDPQHSSVGNESSPTSPLAITRASP